MNRKIKAAIALILAIATVAAVFTGCTNKKERQRRQKNLLPIQQTKKNRQAH